MTVRVAVDAMGGDHAPQAVVEGVAQALRQTETGLSVVLVGNRDIIVQELGRCNASSLPISVIHAEEVVQMDDSPSKVFKAKPNSSMNGALRLQAEGKADASLSAGNTGALLVASMFTLGRIEGVQRAALPVVVPSLKGPCVMIDSGANVDCKPPHLLQFAFMGAAYAQAILDMASPRVGLLSIGQESTKGNELTLATYPLLEQSGLNFLGNAESRSIIMGGFDIIVCDGFVGNIALKLLETIAHLVRGDEKTARQFDSSRAGGTPFLGVNGVCIKAHGASNAEAIKNAVLVATKAVQQGVNARIKDYIRSMP